MFASFGLPAVPTEHLENENEILQSATNTLQDNFNEFEVTPPNLGNLELVDNYNGSGIPPSNFTYQSTPIEMFWFHPDHLGSSNYITNIEGNVSQHMEYLPFGESLVEEHLNSNNSPFRFNAKELDQETGNYYYGARYYDPKFSIWISVDPLAEKFPEWSSYNYVLQNPVNMIDPDGRSPIYDEEGNFLGVDSEGFKGDIIIMNSNDYNSLVDLLGGEDCLLEHGVAVAFGGSFNSLNESVKEKALSNIFTHVLENFDEINISELYGGAVSIYTNDSKEIYKNKQVVDRIFTGYNDPSNPKRYNAVIEQKKITVNINEIYDLKTVEAVQNFLGVHEWGGHILNKYSDTTYDHSRAWQMQKDHPTFHQLSEGLQNNIRTEIKKYREREKYQ